ncbi:MAG: hypothetical protein R2873_20890 [Caldilineaceae bacterium]
MLDRTRDRIDLSCPPSAPKTSAIETMRAAGVLVIDGYCRRPRYFDGRSPHAI